MQYGSPQWIARLRAAGYEPLGRVRGLIVVRLPWGPTAKVVGGTPESPTLIELPRVNVGAEGKASETSTVETTWISWYNTVATPGEQATFDRVADEIDELGLAAMPGGSKDDLLEPYRFTQPGVYPALVNYRDTGGRKALRTEIEERQGTTPAAEQYGDHPIARVQDGGPMEAPSPDGPVTLHPGRYTYSNAMYESSKAPFFPRWLDAAIKADKVQVIRTQVTEGVLEGIPLLEVLSTPYHRDYEFVVRQDILWDSAIPGFPTWLPAGSDVQSYWGKPTGHLPPALPSGDDIANLLQKLFTLGVVLGAGYVVIQLAKAGPKRAPA